MLTATHPTTLGEELKQAREAAGYSQTELAALISEATGQRWHGQQVSDTENERWRFERRRRPNHDFIVTIVRVLDLPPETVIRWDALAGNVNPVVMERLCDPAFAADIYRRATKR